MYLDVYSKKNIYQMFMSSTKLNVMSGKDYKFLYWDDFEDSEDEAKKRMQIIMRNGNSDEHYDIYDDEEEQDVE